VLAYPSWPRKPPPQPQSFYGPFSGTTRVSRCQKRTCCKGRLTEADTLTIRLGATPTGLTSAHLHHPPILFTGQMPFLPPNQQCQSTVLEKMPLNWCPVCLIWPSSELPQDALGAPYLKLWGQFSPTRDPFCHPNDSARTLKRTHSTDPNREHYPNGPSTNWQLKDGTAHAFCWFTDASSPTIQLLI